MSESHDPKRVSEEDLVAGLATVRFLSESIGPRPPCSEQEAQAAEHVAAGLKDLGLAPQREEFRSARSFGGAYLLIFGLALAGSLLRRIRSLRRVGSGLASLAAGTAIAESRFPHRGPFHPIRRRRSRNLHAVIEPEGKAVHTVCVMSHLDSSRSGLMFHPRLTPILGKLVLAAGAATLFQAIPWALNRIPVLRWLTPISRVFLGLSGLLVIERELRGQDVPGANDNASGVGACVALSRGLMRERPSGTRVVLLFTGSEEAGPLGIRDFLARHDTQDWLFINFDGVGADAPLRVLTREGSLLSPAKADPELLRMATEIGREHPELEARPLDFGSGLPYDATPVLASGGRAITIVNQDGAIPDYHWPTDRYDRISPQAFETAVRFGRQLIDRIDRDS